MPQIKTYQKKATFLYHTIESNNILIEKEIVYELGHISFLEKMLFSLRTSVQKLRHVRNRTVIGLSTSRSRGGLSPCNNSKFLGNLSTRRSKDFDRLSPGNLLDPKNERNMK